MDFKTIIETINFELVIEGVGAIFGIGLLWQLFFRQGLYTLFSLFITTLC